MSKRQAFTWIEALVVLAIVAIGAAILYPALTNLGGTPYANKYRSLCQSNLKQIGLAFAQYAKDYDDKFPPSNNVSGLEREPLFAYLGSAEGVFQCPATRAQAANTTDYFFNARLAATDKTKIANPDAPVDFIILGGDGADDANTTSNLSQIPASWRADENSPAWRHLDGANYLFIDGHVKWFGAGQIFGAPNAATPNAATPHAATPHAATATADRPTFEVKS